MGFWYNKPMESLDIQILDQEALVTVLGEALHSALSALSGTDLSRHDVAQEVIYALEDAVEDDEAQIHRVSEDLAQTLVVLDRLSGGGSGILQDMLEKRVEAINRKLDDLRRYIAARKEGLRVMEGVSYRVDYEQ